MWSPLLVTFAASTLVMQLAAAETISDLLSKIPVCSDPCFLTQVPKVCPKGLSAYACQCSPQNQAQLQSLISPCVAKRCSLDTAARVRKLYTDICVLYLEQQGSSSVAPTSTPTSRPSSTPASSSVVSTTATSGGAGSAPAQTTSSHPQETESSSPGLSTGASAGIGVAVAIVGVAILGLIAWIFFRRRKQTRRVVHHEEDTAYRPHDAPTKAELPADNVAQVPTEDPPTYGHDKGVAYAELSPTSDKDTFSPLSMRSELSSNPVERPVYELPAVGKH